jgi:hypothetical protein
MYRTAALLLIALAVAPIATADYRATLEQAYVVASRLLDQEIGRYEKVRDAEREALRQYAEAATRLDDAIANPSVSVEELRRLEHEITELRAIASARAEEIVLLRQRLYDRYDRIAEIGAEIERIGERGLVGPDNVSGFWQIEVQPQGSFGVLRLRAMDTIVNGVYRMSTGRHGSVRGTIVKNRIELQFVDAEIGLGGLEGTIDLEQGEMQGNWMPAQLAPGPGGGSFFARKLAPDEDPQAILGDQ